jgi:hypothetical protein
MSRVKVCDSGAQDLSRLPDEKPSIKLSFSEPVDEKRNICNVCYCTPFKATKTAEEEMI